MAENRLCVNAATCARLQSGISFSGPLAPVQHAWTLGARRRSGRDGEENAGDNEAAGEKKAGYERSGRKRVFWRGGKAKETANSEGLDGGFKGR